MMVLLRTLAVIFAAVSLGACTKNSESTLPAAKTGGVIIDVRSAEEYNSGHLQGAINIPHNEIAGKISSFVPEKSTNIKLYCRSGRRVKIAMEALQKQGYKNLEDFGGIDEARKKLALPIIQ